MIVRVCIENNFDEAAIIKKLDQYQTKEKYKGLKEYDW